MSAAELVDLPIATPRRVPGMMAGMTKTVPSGRAAQFEGPELDARVLAMARRGMSCIEIGSQMGITRKRVSRIIWRLTGAPPGELLAVCRVCGGPVPPGRSRRRVYCDECRK